MPAVAPAPSPARPALWTAYHHDPAALLPADPETLYRQSLARLSPSAATAQVKETVVALGSGSITVRSGSRHRTPLPAQTEGEAFPWEIPDGLALHDLVPRPEEFRDELLPIALRLSDEPLLASINLSTSRPVAFPDCPSLNIILRVYTPERALTAKIKVAIFRTPTGEVWYEVGYVDPRKSLQQFAANFLDQAPDPGRFEHLRDLVDCTKQFITRRPAVAGLDLSPAAFHVLPLCWKLGGRPRDGFDIRKTLTRFETALAHTLATHPHDLPWPVARLAHVPERFLIAHLLERGLLFDPATDRPMVWSPPRLVWPNPKAKG